MVNIPASVFTVCRFFVNEPLTDVNRVLTVKELTFYTFIYSLLRPHQSAILMKHVFSWVEFAHNQVNLQPGSKIDNTPIFLLDQFEIDRGSDLPDLFKEHTVSIFKLLWHSLEEYNNHKVKIYMDILSKPAPVRTPSKQLSTIQQQLHIAQVKLYDEAIEGLMYGPMEHYENLKRIFVEKYEEHVTVMVNWAIKALRYNDTVQFVRYTAGLDTILYCEQSSTPDLNFTVSIDPDKNWIPYLKFTPNNRDLKEKLESVLPLVNKISQNHKTRELTLA